LTTHCAVVISMSRSRSILGSATLSAARSCASSTLARPSSTSARMVSFRIAPPRVGGRVSSRVVTGRRTTRAAMRGGRDLGPTFGTRLFARCLPCHVRPFSRYVLSRPSPVRTMPRSAGHDPLTPTRSRTARRRANGEGRSCVAGGAHGSCDRRLTSIKSRKERDTSWCPSHHVMNLLVRRTVVL
jgi:hypothetical protein